MKQEMRGNVCVFCASSADIDTRYLEAARELGGRCVLVSCGHQMPDRLAAAGCPVAATLADAVRLAVQITGIGS